MADAANCSDMRVGEIWTCDGCGLELQVLKACSDKEGVSCCAEPCAFTCCGEPLRRKEG